MDTSLTIQRLLTEGETGVKAAALSAEHEVQALWPKLKALYEATFGATLLKAEEWIEQAVALKMFHAARTAAPPSTEPLNASPEIQPHEISAAPGEPTDHPSGDRAAHDARAHQAT